MSHTFRLPGAGRWIVAVLILASLVLPMQPASAQSGTLLSRVATAGTVTGGREITVKVYLSAPAGGGGTLVLMSSSNSSLVPVPPTIVVPGGATQGSVRVRTGGTRVNTVVSITAKSGTGVKSTSIMIREPYLSSLSVQTVMRAQGLGRVTIRLSGIAPPGGITVYLNSNRPSILPVPATVVIPEGSASITLKLPTGAVATEVAVNLSASYDGIKITKPTIVRNMP